MPPFVKPNAVKIDNRPEDEKRRELAGDTFDNLLHIQTQLKANGHSLEELLARSAKNVFGVDVSPRPNKKPEPPVVA